MTLPVCCEVKDTLDYKLIKPLQGNYKKWTDSQLEKLCNLIRKRGIRFPSFISKIGDDIWAIDTHRRLMAYERLEKEGYTVPEIPVVYIEAKDKKEAKELLLEVDSRFGTPTQQGFEDFIADLDYDFLADIEIPEINLDFTKSETQGDDDAPEVQEKVVSQLGEIYELGNSLLICGDSTDPDVIKRLMGNDKADMVFTDPPYGVNIVNKKGKVGAENLVKNHTYREVIGDNTTDTAEKAYKLAVQYSEKQIIFGGNYFLKFLPFSYSWLIWDKRVEMNSNNFADGEMAWCSFHTPVRIYKHLWNGMIQEGKREERIHPTQKPVKIVADILVDFTKEYDLVLDMFGGSGSTLIAAEKNNRRARLVELDPHYTDVIRRRYTKWARENNREVGSGGLE